jgi:hypothetical protein
MKKRRKLPPSIEQEEVREKLGSLGCGVPSLWFNLFLFWRRVFLLGGDVNGVRLVEALLEIANC